MRVEAAVDGLDRLHRRRQHAGVTDHVGIGEVDQDEGVVALVELLEQRARQRLGAHLGLVIVGRDVARRRHEHAVLAFEGLLATVVEEEGDVRVLLGLRHAQLRKPRGGEDLAEDVRRHLGCERDG